MRIDVRVQPGARTEGLTWEERGWVLRVRARPVDGAANARVRELLAELLGVRPAKVTLRTGETSRQKGLEVEGDEAELAARLEGLRAAVPSPRGGEGGREAAG